MRSVQIHCTSIAVGRPLLRRLKARTVGPFVAMLVCALLLALAGPPLLRGRIAFRPFPLRRLRRFAHVRDSFLAAENATLCWPRHLRNI